MGCRCRQTGPVCLRTLTLPRSTPDRNPDHEITKSRNRAVICYFGWVFFSGFRQRICTHDASPTHVGPTATARADGRAKSNWPHRGRIGRLVRRTEGLHGHGVDVLHDGAKERGLGRHLDARALAAAARLAPAKGLFSVCPGHGAVVHASQYSCRVATVDGACPVQTQARQRDKRQHGVFPACA